MNITKLKTPCLSLRRVGALLVGAAALLSLPNLVAQEAMRFPIASDNGVISVEWAGDETARAGQKYNYTLRLKNLSASPVHDIVVHQTLPGSFQIQTSTPKVQDAPMQAEGSSMTSQEMMRDEAARRRSEAADNAEQQMDAAAKGSSPGSKSDEAAKKSGTQDMDENKKEADGKTEGKQSEDRSYGWQVGSLEPGATTEVLVTGLPQSEGSLETCIWVSYQPTLCRQIEIVKPDLELTQQILDLEGNPREVFYACEPVLVRYRLTNTGSGSTTDATIAIQAPEGFKALEGESTDVNVGPLDAGESVERLVQFEASNTGTFDFSANATTGELQAQSQKGSVEIVRPELDLTVHAPQTAYVGRSVTYKVEVKNTSDVPALNTTVTLPVPVDALYFVSNGELVPDTSDTFSLGRIDAGESKSFGVTFDPADVGKVNVEAVASAYCAADATQKVVTSVEGIPAVQISVVDRQDPVKVGETTVYEVVVRNEGTAQDLNLQLTGKLPASLEFVEADGDTEVSGEGDSLNFAKLDKLAPGDVASWLVTVKGTSKGRGALRLELQSDAFKRVTSSEPTTVY